jgi:ribonuclease J
MRVCIHRGTKQIGGTCVEIEASGGRIIVDLGLPLDAVEVDPALVPQISGLREHDPSLLAIVLSHGHRDHWGLVPKVRLDIPIVMGGATERIMRAAADFVPDAFAPKAWKHLESGKRLQIGPFAITPHLVDHSGFDAYALEIEAGGRRLFYSGDLRAHGRKRKLFELMLKNPPKNIDVMLMEGSSLGRIADSESFPTEKALERVFIDRFKTTPGIILVACSAQNIDRVVTVYRAAKQTGRTLIVDAYAAEILKATGYDSIPKPLRGWSNLAVFIPQAQRVHLVRKNVAAIVDSYRGFRLWPEQLAEYSLGGQSASVRRKECVAPQRSSFQEAVRYLTPTPQAVRATRILSTLRDESPFQSSHAFSGLNSDPSATKNVCLSVGLLPAQLAKKS